MMNGHSKTTTPPAASASVLVFKEELAPGLRIEADLKQVFASTSSDFQQIEVIETYFGKTLVTDGKTQSTQFDEHAYHECLVHPAMLKADSAAGSPPKSVFIGGGGELATAREVLRHSSVERVLMVDVDDKVVQLSRQYLPEWGGESVYSDPRLEVKIEDAHAYLMNTKETFDVIIMDISDPIEAGPGIMLYTKEFYQHAVTKLNMPHGVFATQSGMAESVPAAVVADVDPSCFAPIHNTLKSAFDCVIPYSVNIPSFGSDWGFNIAFQNTDDNSQDAAINAWKQPESGYIDGLISANIKGGHDSLRFYDGATHIGLHALTKPLRRYMAKDDRVITRENPIFMF